MNDRLKPQVTTQDRSAATPDRLLYIRSFLVMRIAIGAFGVIMPVSLVLVDRFLHENPLLRDSLSAYYHSGVRDIFVGTLCIIAIFLVSYKVLERNLDNTLSTLAGVAAVTVAFFPTGLPDASVLLPTPLQLRLNENVVEAIHYVAAAIFIISLAVLSFYFGVREASRPIRKGMHHSPTWWRNYHWTCAGIIAAALVFMGIFGRSDPPNRALFYGETASIWAFGASWFMKGLELDALRRIHKRTHD